MVATMGLTADLYSGPVPSYACYAFYPLHLLILALIKML